MATHLQPACPASQHGGCCPSSWSDQPALQQTRPSVGVVMIHLGFAFVAAQCSIGRRSWTGWPPPPPAGVASFTGRDGFNSQPRALQGTAHGRQDLLRYCPNRAPLSPCADTSGSQKLNIALSEIYDAKNTSLVLLLRQRFALLLFPLLWSIELLHT